MKINKKSISALLTVLFFCFSLSAFGQTETAGKFKRTDYKTEKFDFGVGGMVSIVGAPHGSITIESWQNMEVEISAEITNEAATEADLAILSKVNGFIVDDGFGKIRIISVGSFDKKHVRKIDRKFPKHLIGAPFRIDYKIKVPFYTDLEINGGRGDFHLSNVEGTIRVNLLESNARFDLVGGLLDATIGSGVVDVNIASRSWRGRSTSVQLASGRLNVHLPLNFNANLDAEVLRSGKIENSYNFLKPREKTKFTDRQMFAKTGSGGVPLKFTVGDGTLALSEYRAERAVR
jgi:hypothetical protein